MLTLKLAPQDYTIDPLGINEFYENQNGSTVTDGSVINNYTASSGNVITNPVTTTTVQTKVYDENNQPLALANISVNGVATAQTSATGQVTIPGLNNSDLIRITYIGYKDVVFSAYETPPFVSMEKTSIVLPDVVVPPKPLTPKPTKKINWLLVILFGAVVVYGGYKIFYDKEKKKVVYAKV